MLTPVQEKTSFPQRQVPPVSLLSSLLHLEITRPSYIKWLEPRFDIRFTALPVNLLLFLGPAALESLDIDRNLPELRTSSRLTFPFPHRMQSIMALHSLRMDYQAISGPSSPLPPPPPPYNPRRLFLASGSQHKQIDLYSVC